MKKFNVLIICLFFISSCTKVFESDKISNLNKYSSPIQISTHLNRVYNFNWPNPGDEFCCLPAVDCWDDMEVIGKTNSSLESEFDKFIESNDQGSLVNYFSKSDWSNLFPYMIYDIHRGIIENRFKVSLRKNSELNNTLIVVVRDIENNVLAAYPIKRLNE
ncbi:MAG TPA: hypothetical protein DCG69_10150 [Bacteroidales bacterium]|nr:hypothetical protein [Bacteroidales bacterium]